MKKKSVLIILGFLFGLNVLAWIGVFQLDHANLEVTFFDVGQGDSIFIETPENYQILIDGGPTSIILEKLGKEMSFWDRTIDLMVLTHPEHDHMAGLIEVLKSYNVKNILWTGVLRDTVEYGEWQKLIKEETPYIYIAQSGQRIYYSRSDLEHGRSDLGYMEVLWPLENLQGQTVKNTNSSSIVLRLVFGENSFLFTGDIYKSIEKEIADLTEVSSDVLKVSHHGSKTSSASEFIEQVSPEIAVIQAGRDNPYGHPDQETLDILEKYGITIFRTDFHGDIKIISDGKNYVSSIQNKNQRN